MKTYNNTNSASVNGFSSIPLKTDYIPKHVSHYEIDYCGLKEDYWRINEYISSTRRFCIVPLIKLLAFLAAKGVPCTFTQKRLAKMYGVSEKCINETIQEMKRIGILHIRKFKDGHSQWLRNQMFLDPIMFTKEMVEVLYEQIDYCKFHKYFSLKSVILIQSNLSSYQRYFPKVSEYWEKDIQFETKTTQQVENDTIWEETEQYWNDNMN